VKKRRRDTETYPQEGGSERDGPYRDTATQKHRDGTEIQTHLHKSLHKRAKVSLGEPCKKAERQRDRDLDRQTQRHLLKRVTVSMATHRDTET